MTTFGWKRKAGANVSKSASTAFENEAKDETHDEAIASGEVDWLTLAPQKRAMVLEDAVAKSNRLKEEGTTLADSERYWEALRKWDDALQLTPEDEKLMEMKAQAYMLLNESYAALGAAEKTVEMKPLWWVGHQTLGRARLALGEVRLAVRSFSYAVHLNPSDEELLQEDLLWAFNLLQKKLVIEGQKAAEEESKTANIVELNEDGTSKEVKAILCRDLFEEKKKSGAGGGGGGEKSSQTLKQLPHDYVFMRN